MERWPRMPLTHVHVRAGRTAVERQALLDGVHAALVRALKIPADDRNQILHEHGPEHFRARYGDDAVFVEVTLFAGRSDAAKRALFAAIVDELEQVGVRRAAVLTVLHEEPRGHWGIRGGQSAAEVELGFDVEV